jgi:hypothetical protein
VLGLSGDAAGLISAGDTGRRVGETVITALFTQGKVAQFMYLARKKSDAQLKKEAVSMLPLIRYKEAACYMMELPKK